MHLKILYLTPPWYGFKEMLFEGRRDLQGLPSFLMPLKSLIEQGNQVDFVILHTEKELPPLNIGPEWIKPENIKRFCFYDLGLPGKFISIWKYRKVVCEVLAEKKYDFVYAHGTSTAVVRGAVRKRGLPFGQRLYGTFLWEKIKTNGLFKAALKHIVEYLSFSRAKDFLLVTNDGSRGDLVKDRIFGNRPPPYEFLYWVNGVARFQNDPMALERFSKKIPKEPFIFYCARFDEWKRQDRVLNIVRALKDKGLLVKVYFAGPFDTLGDHYYLHIKSVVEKLDIAELVVFLGSISRQEIGFYNKVALASLSLYDVCNLTNVFHEMLASGALAIVKNDEVVRDYVKHGVNGYLVDTDTQVVEILEEIIKRPESFHFIRDNAISSSLEKTKDWNERISDEINLISKYALGNKGHVNHVGVE